MKSSTSRRARPLAAVLAVAVLALLAAAGCESMKDPDGQALPWGPSNDWEFTRVPSSLLTN